MKSKDLQQLLRSRGSCFLFLCCRQYLHCQKLAIALNFSTLAESRRNKVLATCSIARRLSLKTDKLVPLHIQLVGTDGSIVNELWRE
ncbi:MAG: hypothetical protein V7L12_05260 [Nostoc sp.]